MTDVARLGIADLIRLAVAAAPPVPEEATTRISALLPPAAGEVKEPIPARERSLAA